jgi:hypothetical protein
MAKKMLKRDFVGRRARLTRQISNGAGTILDKGEIVKIDGTYRGRFSIETVTTCKHCYRRQKVGISQVHESDFTLIDEEAQVTNYEKPRAVRVWGGDWEGLYIDGKLAAEGHSLAVYQVLEALGVSYRFQEVEMDPYEFSSLPATLDEIPEERLRASCCPAERP